MSTELDRELGRLYAALGQETHVMPLASPESLRKRGDRQARTRAALTVAAVAVVVAGVVGGGSVLLSDRDTTVQPAPPVPTPSITSTPTQTPSPSATPSSTPSASSTGTRTTAGRAPSVVPKTIFLTAKDLNSNEPLSKSNDSFLPPLCGKGWSDTEPKTSAVQGAYMRPADAEPTEVPEAQFREGIVVYQTVAQAESWMSGLRQAVEDCPSAPTESGRGEITYELVPEAPVTGEDWLVIHRQEPAYDFASGAPVAGSYDFYTASVRHGDTIVTFHTKGYENWGIANPARFYELVAIGAEKVATWRDGAR